MRRYIALTAALIMLAGCGKNTTQEEATVVPETVPAETQTEPTTQTSTEELASEKVFKPTTADVRAYCVSLDAARNAILNDYRSQIPESLLTIFNANSDALDEYMDKAGKELSDADAERIFNSLQSLETFFCETMAEETGAGDAIKEVAIAATKGADYYFEKAEEESNASSGTEESTEADTDEGSAENSDSKEKKRKQSEDTTEETTQVEATTKHKEKS